MAAALPQPPTDKQAALAQAALPKLRAGKKLTQREERAIEKVTAWNLYSKGLQFSEAVPKAVFVKWSDRTHKVLGDLADRYGFPFDGDTIDQAAAWKAVLTYIVQNWRILHRSDEDPLLAGASQSLKDEYTREQIREKRSKATLAELEVGERRGQLVDREAFRAGIGPAFHVLREAADRLQRRFGTEALDIFNEALDEAQERAVAALAEYVAGRDDAGDA